MNYFDAKEKLEKIAEKSAVHQLVADSIIDNFSDLEEITLENILDFAATFEANGTFDLMDHENYKNFFSNHFLEIFDVCKGEKVDPDLEKITNRAIEIVLDEIKEIF